MNQTLQPLVTGAGFTPPADGFVHVQPYGLYPFTLPPEKGQTQGRQILLVIDEAAVDAQIASFRSAKDAAGDSFAGVLCDFDHKSCDANGSTEASAWSMELQKRPDGLWSKMRWTESGQKAVTGGTYRFMSNVHNPGDCVEIAPGKLRPMRVDRFALTNDPRMLQGAVRMQPISSRADPAGSTQLASGGPTKGPTMDARKILLKILDLPDTATDEDVQKKAETFGKQEAQEAAHKVDELKSCREENAALKSRAEAAEKLVAGQKADATLIALEGEGYKFTSRDQVKARLLANHDDAVAAIRLQPPPAAGTGEALRSRKDAKSPVELTPAQKKEERDRLVDEAQTKFRLKSRASAVARVQASNPELWK